MTIKDYRDAHYRMWDWLVNNPGKPKEDWPEWDYTENFTGVFHGKPIVHHCFLCAFFEHRCKVCAITRNTGRACFVDHHDNPEDNGLFARWCTAMGEDGEQPNYEEATRLAILIRDSWK